MEIRDILHGSIEIERHELPILDSRSFQRLRQIKQLGFSEYSFPSAAHNRYIHSTGAMATASKLIENIFGEKSRQKLPHDTFIRFRAVLRLAALLHDVGHGPLSHTTEFAMPDVDKLKVPGLKKGQSRKATHEDYTLKIILDSSLTKSLEAAGNRYGFKPVHIAALIDPSLKVADHFFEEAIDGQTIDFRPILQQLISSEMDADRMDYLRRDSLCAGVSYGGFDFNWLSTNLRGHVEDGRCFLTLEHKALYTFEDFLISRYHMFLMVYFHYKGVVYDEMLSQYFNSDDCDYSLPSDIEKYFDCDDSHLYSHLSQSENQWAKRIIQKKPYKMLVELHSGIPATDKAKKEQTLLAEKIRKSLLDQNIHYIEATSTGELSKYFQKQKAPIFIRYDNQYSAPSFIPLEKCTDLFQRYREKRWINRIYVSPEDFPKCRYEGRHSPLPFEENLPLLDDGRFI